MSEYTFQGYRRANGKVGARNLVAVIPSVICANDVGQAICRQVQGTIGYFHHQGCCQLPIDLKRVTDTLSNLGQSPNVGAALIVSLGCEGTDHERMVEEIRAAGKPVEIIRIQELGGTSRAIQAGIDAAQRLVQEISGLQRETVDISEVVMAIKCGASDTTSGMASNCVIGYVADKLVDLGATVVFGETTEFLGGEHILAKRAVGGENGPIGQKIYEIVDRMEKRAKSVGEDMRGGQPTPGNIAGGLTTIEEKSLGCIHKAGQSPVIGVLEYSESIDPKKHGLYFMDTPGEDIDSITGMVAGGAQIILFTTGRGTPTGSPVAPVIKVTGNPETYEKMMDNIDINAGRIITEGKTPQDIGEEIFDKMVAVANGELTKAEVLGHKEFGIYRIGDTF